MKVLGKHGMSGFVEWMINGILMGGIGIWISLPWSLPWVIRTVKPQYAGDHIFFYFMLAFLYITGIFALWIVWEMKKFFRSINQNTPFVYENVEAFKKIGYVSFIIACCYMVKIIIYPTIPTIIITMIFMIAGCFGIVVAEVFRQAVNAKCENDLTI